MAETRTPSPLAEEAGRPAEIEAARVRRRRVNIGRRLAAVLVGVVGVVAVVVWNRGVMRRNACRTALERLATEAREARLGTVPLELQDAEWLGLPKTASGYSAAHYRLIGPNWAMTPQADRRFPLALCDEAHLTLFGRGRHVLFATREGDVVEWVTEDGAAPVLKKVTGTPRAEP